MKRDVDLIRSILMTIEEKTPGRSLQEPEFEGYDAATIAEHVELLIDADLIKAKVEKVYGGSIINIDRLTWQGNEFLDAARDNTLWNSAKKKLIKESGSWTFSLLFEYLKQEAKTRIGLP